MHPSKLSRVSSDEAFTSPKSVSTVMYSFTFGCGWESWGSLPLSFGTTSSLVESSRSSGFFCD